MQQTCHTFLFLLLLPGLYSQVAEVARPWGPGNNCDLVTVSLTTFDFATSAKEIIGMMSFIYFYLVRKRKERTVCRKKKDRDLSFPRFYCTGTDNSSTNVFKDPSEPPPPRHLRPTCTPLPLPPSERPENFVIDGGRRTSPYTSSDRLSSHQYKAVWCSSSLLDLCVSGESVLSPPQTDPLEVIKR